MMEQVCSEKAVEQYFKLNSPRLDSVEISHIVLDSEGKAKEMMSALADDPDSFAEMVNEHSVGEARENGAVIGKVLRGSLRPDLEARLFNAAPGDLLGVFTPEELDQLAESIETRTCAFGDAICSAGDAAEGRHVIKSGSVRVFGEEHGKEISMGVRKRGEVFAEVAMLSATAHRPRCGCARNASSLRLRTRPTSVRAAEVQSNRLSASIASSSLVCPPADRSGARSVPEHRRLIRTGMMGKPFRGLFLLPQYFVGVPHEAPLDWQTKHENN